VALFLVWHDERAAVAPELLLALDHFELRPGLNLVDSDLETSKLYHRIKWALPIGTTLLVAPLAGPPKFKLMTEGALGWVRRRGAGFRNGDAP
jgi:hypothetical protein